MITNHMKLFGTNQVLVFINLQGLRDWKLFNSFLKGRFWRNQVDSKKRFKLGRSKVWILKKPSWWRLEESVTLYKILECKFWCWIDVQESHTLAQVIYTKIITKKFQKPDVLFKLSTVLSDCRQACRHVLFKELSIGISSNSRFFGFWLAVDNPWGLWIVDMSCISRTFDMPIWLSTV